MNHPANQSSNQKEKKLSPLCPYIGMKQDSGTFFSYPSPGNHCYHVKPSQPIKISYQEEFCLSLSYPSCQVYSPSWEGPLPQEIAGETAQIGIAGLLSRRLILIAIIGLALFLLGSYFLFIRSPNPFTPSGSISQSATSTIVEEMIETETPKFDAAVIPSNTQGVSLAQVEEVTETPTSISPSATPSLTSSQITEPTSTPTAVLATPGPVMETPFGPDERFLLHTVQQAESYSKIAATYQTSIEVIQNTNDLIEGASLWVDTILVIMPGQIEFSGVPKFRIILLENPTSISDLAEEHEVSADEVIYYNSLGSIEIIPSGRWLIIPIEK
jgi:LysM repeat protein